MDITNNEELLKEIDELHAEIETMKDDHKEEVNSMQEQLDEAYQTLKEIKSLL